MTGLTGNDVDRMMILTLLVVCAVAVVIALRRSARLAFVVALVALCLVPVWVGVAIGFNGNFFLPLNICVTVVAVVAMLPTPRLRFGMVDGFVVALVLVSVAALFAGNTAVALSFLTTMFTYFIPGYLLGRIAAARIGRDWLYAVVAVVFSVVAVLAIVEFIAGWNPFIDLGGDGRLLAEWGTLQERGGQLRAEGAFGHSIALGSSLALAIPLALGSSLRPALRGGITLLLVVASALTLSRTGIIGALLGVLLTVLFLRTAIGARLRIAITVVTVAASLALFPVMIAVFEEAGAEASGSAAYRGNLLQLVPDMNLVGVSDLVRRAASGELYFENFQSIDSQLILTGVTSGSLALSLVLIALIMAVIRVLGGRADAPTIAVVAQIPALATVALITQYSTILWLVIGLAASGTMGARPASGAATTAATRDPALARIPTPVT